MKYISKKSGDTDFSNNEQLPHVLLDLACYKYNDLIQRSLLLLDRYYTANTDIFQKALQSWLLLTPQSIDFFNMVDSLSMSMTSYLKSLSSTADGISPLKELTKYLWLEDEVEGFEPHQINQSIILSFGMIICLHRQSLWCFFLIIKLRGQCYLGLILGFNQLKISTYVAIPIYNCYHEVRILYYIFMQAFFQMC